MKGFLYLIEIAVAGVLVAIILGSFFAAQSVSLDWDRADLIGVGNNLFDTLDDNSIKVLNESMDDNITELKPPNIKYVLKFSGIPKETIKVGSNNPGSVDALLQDSYLNNRFIKYEVYNLNSEESLDEFDVIVLSDYTYSDVSDLEEFAQEKVVIGIEDVDTGGSFKSFYGLTAPVGSAAFDFAEYDNIKKYFLGFGFVVPKVYTEQGTGYEVGYLYLKGDVYTVKFISGQVCEGTECTPSEPERGTINIGGVNFLIKKIEWTATTHKVYLAIKDTDFTFDSSFSTGLKGNAIIGTDDYAAMTRSENKIWISSFDLLDHYEYMSLVQAAVASSVMDWYTETPGGEERAEISRFVSLCCDVAEVAEMSFVLWYVF